MKASKETIEALLARQEECIATNDGPGLFAVNAELREARGRPDIFAEEKSKRIPDHPSSAIGARVPVEKPPSAVTQAVIDEFREEIRALTKAGKTDEAMIWARYLKKIKNGELSIE